MKLASNVLALTLVGGLTACAAFDMEKSSIKVDLDDEAKYVKRMCANDAMVGNKRGLDIAIEAKYQELTAASGQLNAGVYRALSQELGQYTATAQILHNEQHQRCLVYQQCVYRATFSRKDIDSCASQDAAVKETADRIRTLLSGIQQIKPVE